MAVTDLALRLRRRFDRAPIAASVETAARVGFFLEQRREALMLEEGSLDSFRDLAPAQPRYLDAQRERGRLVSGWNLIVPERILARAWDEVR